MANQFDTIRLEKGMYQEAGRSFTQVLEGLDPSEQYKGTRLEGLDAFQRQLKRFDIKVTGAGSDPVEQFFRPADSAVRFPGSIPPPGGPGLEGGHPLPPPPRSVKGADSKPVDPRPQLVNCVIILRNHFPDNNVQCACHNPCLLSFFVFPSCQRLSFGAWGFPSQSAAG